MLEATCDFVITLFAGYAPNHCLEKQLFYANNDFQPNSSVTKCCVI